MTIEILKGIDLDKDRLTIMEKFKSDTAFLLDSNKALYEYIDELQLGDPVLYKLKICKELHNLNVVYNNCEDIITVHHLSELLSVINISKITYVTVKGDLDADEERCAAVRTQLSDIVQQMVYLNLPLEKIQVLTEREYQNIEKVKNYEEMVPVLEENLKKSLSLIQSDKFAGFEDIYEEVHATLEKICDCVEESKSSEMKIAVAASKKTGKSVIVNSMIECELAPTSLELATPNNCIYTKRNDGKYSVSYGNAYKEYVDPKKVKDDLTVLFKQVQMDVSNGCALPDMNIGYINGHDGFSSYTVYDTPGPDLAGAAGHKEAADRAMQVADVIVFAIDYSKYLTDSEMEYLRSIKKICNEKQKYYSLIFAVNKLDLRYDSEGDKSVIRILDFIREKLIAIDPQFRDSIVMGTSALTYFNCLSAVSFDGCECLAESTGFRNNLDDCIDHYIGMEEMTTLNFISKMCQNTRNFHGKKIDSLDELKQISGMPNLLNYISYIARDKARTERINNLLYHIDFAYKKIQNLFCFQELEEALAENKDLLQQAKTILGEFTNKVNSIFDESYPDIKEKARQRKCLSTALGTVGKENDFRISKILDYFIQRINDVLNPSVITEYIAFQDTRKNVSQELKRLFEASEFYKKIDGVKQKVISEQDIIAGLDKVISELEPRLCVYINDKFDELWKDLKIENKNIQNDFEILLNQRISMLRDAVEDCQKRLDCECGIPFNLEVPEFNFAFKRDNADIQRIIININSGELSKRIERAIDSSLNNKKIALSANSALNRVMSKIGLLLKNEDKINRICYDRAYFLSELYDKDLKWDVKSMIERIEIGNTYKEDKEVLEEEAEKFIEYIESEAKAMHNSAIYLADGVKKSVDHTEDYVKRIDLLKQKRVCLEYVKDCTEEFQSNWLHIMEG